MKSSWNLSRLGGIASSPYWSFLVALFWVALTSLAAGVALALAFHAAFFILAAFGCANLLVMALLVVLARRRGAPGVKFQIAGDSPVESQSAVHADRCPSFIVLPAHARADEMTRVLFAHQSYFPVAQGREVVGVISKGRLLRAMSRGHGDRLIA
ncbi:MAG: hypothetical protein ABSG53_32995, partial [Thermoguttaceae bacterium]